MDVELFDRLIRLYFAARCFQILHSPGEATQALRDLNLEVDGLWAEFYNLIRGDKKWTINYSIN